VTHIVINDKSQGSVATYGGIFNYCIMTNLLTSFVERTFKIGQHMAKLWARMLIASTALCARGQDTVLLKDELAKDMTYGGQELLYQHHIMITGLTDPVSRIDN